jgi:glycosyltransferase involved in cell wall biosynthesis
MTTATSLHQTRVDFEIFGHEFPWVDWDKFDGLPNGVDPPRAAGASRSAASRLEVLFVGRVDDPRKGFDHLADAWRELAPRVPDARLTVLGAVSKARAHTLRRDHGERIRVLGLVPEDRLEQAYAEADVLVMPSLYEGFGMPNVEAMRYGVRSSRRPWEGLRRWCRRMRACSCRLAHRRAGRRDHGDDRSRAASGSRGERAGMGQTATSGHAWWRTWSSATKRSRQG